MPAISTTDNYVIAALERYGQGRATMAEIGWAVRTMSAAPHRPRSSHSHVELRTATTPDSVFSGHLSDSVRDAIDREIHASYHQFGGRLETGGLLLAHYPARSDDAHVVCATGPGNAQHAETSMRYFPDSIRADYPEFPHEVGAWHTHPDTHGTPSRADLDCWRESLQSTGGTAYLGVIAAARNDGTGWQYPRLHGWVCRRTTSGGFYVEPAHLPER
jgi:proteasome lid subunit RPN8/RPN11